jgi:hypothetical protein
MAEWLGIAQPRNIRQVIEANKAELEEHGDMHFENAYPEPGQPERVANEYWLNVDQATTVCILSRTPRSAAGSGIAGQGK